MRSSRSVRSAISSETFAAQRVANALTSQSAPRDPPALPAPLAPPAPPVPPAQTAPEHQPELPTAQSIWLEWFATHAPSKNGPFSREGIRMLADAGVPQNSEFPAFANPHVSVRNRVAELERAQTGSEHGSDHGKGGQRFLDERDWELQSARARVQELESLIKRQGSRTSFESAVGMDPQTPPGLLAATLHSRPTSVADLSHEWYAASVHDPHESVHVHAHVSHAPTPPPPAPPPGVDDDSSSSSESDVEARKRKKEKHGLYKVKNAEMCLPQYPNALTL